MRPRGVCAVDVSFWFEVRMGRITIAYAIPTNAPTLRMAGVQSAPSSPLESRFSSSTGVESRLFEMVSESPLSGAVLYISVSI
jgi:hypothetical protein